MGVVSNPLPIPDELWDKVPPDAQAAIAAVFLAMQQWISDLEARVLDLEARLELNSTNSSKPPSTDPIGMKQIVGDLFGLSISTGMVSKLERLSAEALEAP